MLAYEKCKSRPIGNKSKTQPRGDEDKKKFVECGMLYFECAVPFAITFMMEVAISNGFGIKHLRIFNTFGNLHGHII
jgi:hypothetical protein